jgi:hypothetical protein
VIDKNLSAVPREVGRKILHDNAAKLYHIAL